MGGGGGGGLKIYPYEHYGCWYFWGLDDFPSLLYLKYELSTTTRYQSRHNKFEFKLEAISMHTKSAGRNIISSNFFEVDSLAMQLSL